MSWNFQQWLASVYPFNFWTIMLENMEGKKNIPTDECSWLQTPCSPRGLVRCHRPKQRQWLNSYGWLTARMQAVLVSAHSLPPGTKLSSLDFLSYLLVAVVWVTICLRGKESYFTNDLTKLDFRILTVMAEDCPANGTVWSPTWVKGQYCVCAYFDFWLLHFFLHSD